MSDEQTGHGADDRPGEPADDGGDLEVEQSSRDDASPHPAQQAPWSILRMTMAARLAAALAVCAVLWGVVFLAMR